MRRRSLVVAIVAGLAITLLVNPRPSPAQSTHSPATMQEHYLTPVEAKLSPDGTNLYVVCEDDDSLLNVDVRSERVTHRANVGHKPKDVAISPDGQKLYVSNEWSDTVTEIDAASFKVLRTIPTGWGPIGLTTDRAGKFLYVANSIGNDVSVIELRTGTERKRLASWRSPHQVCTVARRPFRLRRQLARPSWTPRSVARLRAGGHRHAQPKRCRTH